MLPRLILAALIVLLPSHQPLRAATPAKGLHAVPLTAQTQGGEALALYQQSHALLIGVSDYTEGWGDLESIPRELDAVQAVLEAQGFHVRRVSNPDALAAQARVRGVHQ